MFLKINVKGKNAFDEKELYKVKKGLPPERIGTDTEG
jgi:hypothetical protein